MTAVRAQKKLEEKNAEGKEDAENWNSHRTHPKEHGMTAVH